MKVLGIDKSYNRETERALTVCLNLKARLLTEAEPYLLHSTIKVRCLFSGMGQRQFHNKEPLTATALSRSDKPLKLVAKPKAVEVVAE